MTSLTLSRGKLTQFLNCQRRFQLQHVTRLAWPAAPLPTQLAAAFAKGEAFHQIAERHFLGMPISLPEDVDADVARWWRTFERDAPDLPAGQHFPEAAMTVSTSGFRLFGRFDLLITNDNTAHIFDWKTERLPRPERQLREDWQTRLYLALITEGGDALGRSYAPDNVSMTYWFAEAPEKSVTIRYSTDWHRQNWAEIKATLGRIERRLEAADSIWPLTKDLDQCARCGFRSYCGRDVAAVAPAESEVEAMVEDSAETSQLEPVYASKF